MARLPAKNAPRRRSAAAKALGLRLYRPRVVPNGRRKALNRLVQSEAVDRMSGDLRTGGD